LVGAVIGRGWRLCTPETTNAHVDAIAAAIRKLPSSSTALVVGHTTTVPVLIKQLGGPQNVSIGHTEFDRLFVLHSDRLTQLRYGAAA
jgi:phosphohistidine phosphatase SixA